MPGTGVGLGVGLERNRNIVVLGTVEYTWVTDAGDTIVTDDGDAFVTDPMALIGLFLLGDYIVNALGEWIKVI